MPRPTRFPRCSHSGVALVSLPRVLTDGRTTCGLLLWRFGGRLEVTIVVKATFSLVQDGAAEAVAPRPVLTEDRYVGGHPSHSLEAASDSGPLPCTLRCPPTGHVYTYGSARSAAAARLSLARDGQTLLAKTIHVYGDRSTAGVPQPFERMPLMYERAFGGHGELNPIGSHTPNLVNAADARRPAALGPIPRWWPARSRLLGTIDRKALDGPIPDVPDATPWGYFQSAPPDQQVDHLCGNEWITLEGLHPTFPRYQTHLPGARGAARILVKQGPSTTETPVEAVCDRLVLEPDQQTLSLTWRGHYGVREGEQALASLVVLAALESAGAPGPWAQLADAAGPGLPCRARRPCRCGRVPVVRVPL